jgi:hypothetical protein
MYGLPSPVRAPVPPRNPPLGRGTSRSGRRRGERAPGAAARPESCIDAGMARDQEQRGKLPEIRTNQDTITFVLTIAVQEGTTAKLVLRCERDGGMYASIRPASSRDPD